MSTVMFLLYLIGYVLSVYPIYEYIIKYSPSTDNFERTLAIGLAGLVTLAWPIISVIATTYTLSRRIWTGSWFREDSSDRIGS